MQQCCKITIDKSANVAYNCNKSTKRSEARKMNYKCLITIGMWVLGAVCVWVMKKIEPDNKIYPVWALFIALAFTGFALYDWLG